MTSYTELGRKACTIENLRAQIAELWGRTLHVVTSINTAVPDGDGHVILTLADFPEASIIQGDVAALEEALQTLAQSHVELRGRVTSLDGDLTHLEGDVAALEETLQTLSQAHDELSGYVTSLDGDLTHLEGDVAALETTTEGLTQAVAGLSVDTAALASDALLSVRELSTEGSATAVKVKGVRKNASTTPGISLPVASASSAGVLNVSDYTGLKGLVPRVEALEQGIQPEPVPVGTWSLEEEGLIKGSELSGQLYPEADGTGSVVGWDDTQDAIEALEEVAGGLVSDVDDLNDTVSGLAGDVETLEGRVDLAEVDLGKKADKTEVNDGLALKADKTELALKADKTEVALKADKTEVALKADKTEVALKADKTEVALKADKLVLIGTHDIPSSGTLNIGTVYVNRRVYVEVRGSNSSGSGVIYIKKGDNDDYSSIFFGGTTQQAPRRVLFHTNSGTGECTLKVENLKIASTSIVWTLTTMTMMVLVYAMD